MNTRLNMGEKWIYQKLKSYSMSNNDEDLSTFLMDYGFTEDELFAVTYELNSFRSIPGTTVRKYLIRVLQTINEDDRAAFLKGILVGVAIKNAVDALNDALDEEDITDEEMRVAREIERLQGLDREGQ
jgi:hypothetical protein